MATKHSGYRNIASFVTIAFLYSWPIFFVVDAWIVPMLVQQAKEELATLVMICGHMLAMLGPALAAIIMWRTSHKGDAPVWKWGRWKHYGIVFIAMAVLWVLPGFVGLGLWPDAFSFRNPIPQYVWLSLAAWLFFGWFAGMGEELGWCTYLLPQMTPSMGKTRALVVSGLIRGLWHWPVLVGPILAQVLTGEKTITQLLILAMAFAVQLGITNILMGAVFSWLWYKTESQPLTGWLHQCYDAMRDVTPMFIVGYGASIWPTVGLFLFMAVGVQLMMYVARSEGGSFYTLLFSSKNQEMHEKEIGN